MNWYKYMGLGINTTFRKLSLDIETVWTFTTFYKWGSGKMKKWNINQVYFLLPEIITFHNRARNDMSVYL